MESVTTRVNLLGDPTNHRRHPVSGLDGVKLATEASPGVNRQASEGGDTTVGTAASKSEKTSIRLSHRIGAWNVRGLLEAGKLTIVEKEMESHDISILGISETHMRGNGHFTTVTGNTMYFSGCEDSSLSGVGIILPPHLNKYVLGYNPVSDRILTMKLNTNPCVLNVIQIYAPTAQAQDELIVDFYGKLEEILNSIPSREIKIILGDWNAKVGSTLDDNHIRSTVGKFGLGIRNERGEKLIEFCIERNLSIMNTYFQHHPRRLYTWRSPGDRYRNQIDYIILDGRWRSSVSNVKTFPGAECRSDHNLLVANFSLRLKAPIGDIDALARMSIQWRMFLEPL
ncbi:craniofacial development protein 2 [Bombyx mori]|uniref:Endonuclease/exonuclease/phosphatase domain-containing protein n=1 Tax=Bombyx mori TaxID=7091 RepID=A0A8R2LXH2_BOMMO|nr:craniofacial development protein 2-like [Bombyx mori]